MIPGAFAIRVRGLRNLGDSFSESRAFPIAAARSRFKGALEGELVRRGPRALFPRRNRLWFSAPIIQGGCTRGPLKTPLPASLRECNGRKKHGCKPAAGLFDRPGARVDKREIGCVRREQRHPRDVSPTDPGATSPKIKRLTRIAPPGTSSPTPVRLVPEDRHQRPRVNDARRF